MQETNMSTPSKPLPGVERDAATVAGDRRENALRAAVTGRAVFLYARPPLTFPAREIGGAPMTVCSILVWAGSRTNKLWIEVRGDQVPRVQTMTEGSLISFAGQLVIVEKGTSRYVTVRAWEIALV